MRAIIKSTVATLAILFGLSHATQASGIPQPAVESSEPAPIVPVDIYRGGRQEVTRYLLGRIDTVQIEVKGRSVVTTRGQNTWYIGREHLQELGYSFNGLFSELSDAVSKIQVETDVLPLESGGYDLYLEIVCRDTQGRKVLTGQSWLPVELGKDALISRGEPWVSIPDEVDVEFPGEIRSAKWLSLNYDRFEPMEFYPYSDEMGRTTRLSRVPTAVLDFGYLAVADLNGEVSVISLTNGYILQPKEVLVLLGQMNSSEVVIVRSPDEGTRWTANQTFWKSEGKIFGRFPLQEIVQVKEYYAHWVDLGVSVWGSDIKVYPLWAKLISVDDGKELYLPIRKDTGMWLIELMPGTRYHLEVDFGGQVLDYNLSNGEG